MKRYLLIVGVDYYPGAGTRDWVDLFDSKEELMEEIERQRQNADWYLVVDLFEWKKETECDVIRF